MLKGHLCPPVIIEYKKEQVALTNFKYISEQIVLITASSRYDYFYNDIENSWYLEAGLASTPYSLKLTDDYLWVSDGQNAKRYYFNNCNH